MKTLLPAALALVLLFGCVLCWRTVRHPFTPLPEAVGGQEAAPVTEIAVQRLAGGIRIPTISHQRYESMDFDKFRDFGQYLREAYPGIFEQLEFSTVNEFGLVLRWPGKNPDALPVLFLSHYDVVPVQGYDPESVESKNATPVFRPSDPAKAPMTSIAAAWDYPPFSGAVADGRIYGRGTLDMKGMLFSLLEAVEELMAEGFEPERDIWLAFGHDEEVGGLRGATAIAARFQEQGMRFAAVFDEGGIIAAPESVLPELDRPLALVGLAEKGFLTLSLRVHGQGGHSSLPPARGALVQAAELILKLNDNPLPARITEPVAEFLDNTGAAMGFAARLAIANRWLLDPLLKRQLTASPASAALVRTTTAVTMASGSDAANVLSSTASITVNFRLLPGDSVADVLAHVTDLCAGYQVDIEVVNAREPSSLTPLDGPALAAIKQAVEKAQPGTLVTPYLTVGGTDAYKYQGVSDHIYRFMPVKLTHAEQQSIHSENEYISLANYGAMIRHFRELMRQVAGS